MKFDFQSITNSRFGVNLALWIGRTLPRGISYRIGEFGATLIAKRDNAITRAVRINQWVARGEKSTAAELEAALVEVFSHAGRCFADLYRNLMNPEGLKALVPNTQTVERLIAQSRPDTTGAFIVAPHMSAFDLVLLAIAYHGVRAQVLSYGNPTGGYEIQNQIRSVTGLEITPVRGEETHRQAIEHMRNGGIVITAVDRPIRKKAHMLSFCGHPSPLPAGHIRMALEAEVPVLVAAAQFQPDGKYHLLLSDPIVMQPHPDPGESIRKNAETVLQVIEGYIRQTPGQWLMYYPCWPDVELISDG